MSGRAVHVEIPEWFEPIEFAGPDVRSLAIWSGRGGGKSMAVASKLIREAVKDPNSSTLCVRETQKSLNESVKAELVTAIRMLGVEDQFEVQDARIRHRHGQGAFHFVGMQNHTADGVKSLSGYKRAWVEEAATLSRTSLEVLTPTIRLPGSSIYYTWNPARDDDPVDEMFRCNSEAAKERNQKPPASAIVVTCSYASNPWFGEPLLTEMRECRARDLDAFNHIWLGRYRRASEARIFRNVKVQEFETTTNAVFYFGADWGFSVDPTVLVRCYIEGRTLYVDHEAVMVGCEVDDTPALFATIPGAEKWTIVADHENPQMISHMNRKGFKVLPAIKGVGSVEAGVDFLKTMDIVVHPRCKVLVEEFLRFSYKVDKRTQRIIPEIDDSRSGHVDVIHALRYAVESVRRGIGAKPAAPTAPPPPLANHWNR